MCVARTFLKGTRPELKCVAIGPSRIARQRVATEYPARATWCDESGVFCCFGLARNDRPQDERKANFESLKTSCGSGGDPSSRFSTKNARIVLKWRT